LQDPQVHLEVITIVGEIEWRLRSLERESLLRTGLVGGQSEAVMRELVARLTGRHAEPQAAAPAASGPAQRTPTGN
jgi:hypothetical protein